MGVQRIKGFLLAEPGEGRSQQFTKEIALTLALKSGGIWMCR